MATVKPSVSPWVNGASTILWEACATGDTIQPYRIPGLGGAVAAVQMAGTWGSATATLAASNDGTNYATLTDATGTAISMTANGLVDFSTAALYIKPTISGGTGDDVDVTVILRGDR